MKVKDKVYRYEIKLDYKTGEVTQEQNEYTVIGVNSNRICIDDRSFTSIKYKKSYKDDTETLFNEVGVVNFSNSYSDYIYGYLYSSSTSKKIAYARIKNELAKLINKKLNRCYEFPKKTEHHENSLIAQVRWLIEKNIEKHCNAIAFLEKIEF